jgi:hypothetical protein
MREMKKKVVRGMRGRVVPEARGSRGKVFPRPEKIENKTF